MGERGEEGNGWERKKGSHGVESEGWQHGGWRSAASRLELVSSGMGRERERVDERKIFEIRKWETENERPKWWEAKKKKRNDTNTNYFTIFFTNC